MTTAIRSVRFQGWDDQQEEIERKRSEKGIKFRKELKRRKLLRKKEKREVDAARQREEEELDLFLRFLYNFPRVDGPDRLSLHRFLQGEGPHYNAIRNTLGAMLGDNFYNELLQRLNVYFGEKNRSFFFSNINRHLLCALMFRMREYGFYTELDQFLQFIFSFANELLREHLVGIGNENRRQETRVDVSDVLNSVYRESDEECMTRFLDRTLNEFELRRLDSQDLPNIGVRLEGFRRMRGAFVALEIYKPGVEEPEAEDVILTSGSSDAEEKQGDAEEKQEDAEEKQEDAEEKQEEA